MTKIEELVNALDAYNELDQMDINRMTACGRAVYVGLDALPELRALRWIPVEERLPEDDREVELTWRRYGEGKHLRAFGKLTMKDGQRRWRETIELWLFHKAEVTHWRERTPGPEGGGE